MKAKGRGSNPNSHHNKPKLGVEAKKVLLTPKQWAIAQEVGQGNTSAGVRQLIDRAISIGVDTDKLFAALPVIGRAKLALQLLLENHPRGTELAESVLLELEELEIELTFPPLPSDV